MDSGGIRPQSMCKNEKEATKASESERRDMSASRFTPSCSQGGYTHYYLS
jgi:hypothetical protein